MEVEGRKYRGSVPRLGRGAEVGRRERPSLATSTNQAGYPSGQPTERCYQRRATTRRSRIFGGYGASERSKITTSGEGMRERFGRELAAVISVAAVLSVGLAIPVTAKAHKPTVESAWCSLKIGQPAARAAAELGRPHGSRAKSLIRAMTRVQSGLKAEEWDQSSGKMGPKPVLLVTLSSGHIAKLQAYGDWPKYPIPATGLSCKAFRTSPHSTVRGPKVYAVGQTMTNGAHQRVTVTAFAQGVAASAFSTPSPGDQCVSVQVALFNGDSSPWDLPLYELTAVDANGQSYDSYSSFDCPSSDSIDSLVPGGRASATLYFEVPLSGRLLLQWTPSSLNPNSVYNTELKAS